MKNPVRTTNDQTRVEDISKIVDQSKEGVNIVCGGFKPDDKNLTKGNFYAPTIATNISHNSHDSEKYLVQFYQYLSTRIWMMLLKNRMIVILD